MLINSIVSTFVKTWDLNLFCPVLKTQFLIQAGRDWELLKLHLFNERGLTEIGHVSPRGVRPLCII